MFYLKKLQTGSVKISQKECLKLVTEVCSSDIHKTHHILKMLYTPRIYVISIGTATDLHTTLSVAYQAISF